MRRLLDLNGPSVTALKVAAVFLLLIPAGLSACALVLGWLGLPAGIIPELTRVSLIAGALILAGLVLLVVVEQIQDHVFDWRYRRHRSRKLRHADGSCECQFCGNRQVREGDQHCGVCGKRLT